MGKQPSSASKNGTIRVEVIGIGDEILAGFTINSNAAHISRILGEAGYQVVRHTVLPDSAGPLKVGLQTAIENSDIVICTGGLGPTVDDNTRQIVAELVGSDFGLNETVHKHLIKRYGDNLPSVEDQATIPMQAEPLLNWVGSAPGLVFTLKNTLLVLLPGVPVEMEALLEEQLVPLLKERFPPSPVAQCETLRFYMTREVDVDAAIRSFPPDGIGIYPSLGVVTVRLKGPNRDKIRDHLMQTFGDRAFSSPSGTIEEAVHQLAIAKGVTIATAESCSAGGLAAHLTRYSGASDFYLGGIVAYSNEVKGNVLGVSAETLQTDGAVSEASAAQMAEGVRKVTGANLAISTTGIAGPTGATDDKPIGTVCFGLATDQGTTTSTCHFRGNRAAVITRTIHHALALLHTNLS